MLHPKRCICDNVRSGRINTICGWPCPSCALAKAFHLYTFKPIIKTLVNGTQFAQTYSPCPNLLGYALGWPQGFPRLAVEIYLSDLPLYVLGRSQSYCGCMRSVFRILGFGKRYDCRAEADQTSWVTLLIRHGYISYTLL